MGWLRDRLARLGVRGPFGRDAVAAAVLAVLGLVRIPATRLVNGGRLPVPTWQLAAANLASTADAGTIALRRRAPRPAGRRAPQPTLERLDKLVAAASVAAAVDGTGVRVVANTGGAAKGVESAFGRPSTDSDRQDRRSGHGLAGMRERVQLTGGTLAAGPTAPQVTRRLIAEFARSRPLAPPPDELRGLTNRERVILQLVAHGLSNAEIGQRLAVSPSTVKTHVGSLLAKLGCRDRVQAVVYAYEHRVVTPGEDATGQGADGEEGRR